MFPYIPYIVQWAFYLTLLQYGFICFCGLLGICAGSANTHKYDTCVVEFWDEKRAMGVEGWDCYKTDVCFSRMFDCLNCGFPGSVV